MSVKKEEVKLNTSEGLYLEYMKCFKKPSYAIQKYLTTFDNTQKKSVPFNLFDGQRLLISNYDNFRHQIVLKYRQAGISTVTAAYCATKCVFVNPEAPEKIVIIANKLATGKEFLNKIKNFISQYPDWLNITYITNSATSIKLSNGSEIIAVGTSKDAFRGFTPTIVIMDEAAFIDVGDDFWSATMAAVSTGGKVFLISTPNGQDPIYYPNYEKARDGSSDFKITHLKWYFDPRYNKGLKLVKTDNIVDWMCATDEEKDATVIENVLNTLSEDKIIKKVKEEKLTLYNSIEDKFDNKVSYICTFAMTKEDIDEKVREGYKPYCDWYHDMCKSFKYVKRDINRELECEFMGSGDNVVEATVISKQERENVIDPKFKDKFWDYNMWIWKEPIEGHKYILTLDVSRGDAEDYTGMQIIDTTDWEQVAEYQGRIKPDIAAKLVYQYGIMYNALTSFDISGGMGLTTINELKNMGYPKKLFHYDLTDTEMYSKATDDLIPGIDFGKKNRRTEIVSAMEVGVSREDFKIRSARVINELRKFIYKNGRPDHTKNSHDDLIMPLGMAIFIANKSFKNLSSAGTAKVMMESWTLVSNKGQVSMPAPNLFVPDYGNNFRIVEMPNTDMRSMYMEFGKSLFGKGYEKHLKSLKND
jgi:hypothetical protein